MLNRPGDPDRHIERRGDRAAGLPDLMGRSDPPFLDGAAGSAHGGLEQMGHFLDECEVFRFLQSPASRDNGIGFRELGRLILLGDHFEDLDATLQARFGNRHGDNLASVAGALGRFHYLRAHRGHLRSPVGADDGGHDIAAKGRAGLQQQAFVVDIELGTVGGQAGAEGGRYPRNEGAADGGGAGEQDLRLVPVDQFHHSLGISVVAEVGECGVVHHINRVGAVGNELLDDHVTQLVSQQHCCQGDGKLVRQNAAGAQEFVGHFVDRSFAPLGKHPDALIACQVRRRPRPHFGQGKGPKLAGIHAHPAKCALIRDLDGCLGDGDGGEGADIDTNAAQRALLAIDQHFHIPGTLASLR